MPLGTFANIFVVLLCAAGGTLWLGGSDPSAASAPSFTPMVAANALDAVTLAAVGVGSHAAAIGATARGDTGTTTVILPTAADDTIAGAVGADATFAQNFTGGASWFAAGGCALPAHGLTKAQLDAALPPLQLTFPTSTPGTTFTVDRPATDACLLGYADSGGNTSPMRRRERVDRLITAGTPGDGPTCALSPP